MTIKYTLLIFTLVFLSLQKLNAQQNMRVVPDSIKNNYRYYMKKRGTYNTVGWVCLGTGVGLGIIGLGEAAGGGLSDVVGVRNNNTAAKGTVLFAVGNVVALASIPFFIAAHHNKKKASLSLKSAGVTFNNRSLYKSGNTALSIKIAF